jgi:uncharacterized protein
MSAEANVDVVRKGYASYASGDVATIFALFDPEIEITQTTELPWGGHYKGHAEAKQFFEKIFANVQAMPQPDSYISAGESVVAIGRLRGHAKQSGKLIDLAIAHVWTVRDGRIVRFDAYIDTPAMLAALEL